jgi:Protein of unknown function (DUF4019)
MHAPAIAAVALAAVTTGGKSGQRPYALLTLASGHTFRVLNSGPVVDETKKRIGIAYVSSAQNVHELQADADELFEYLLPRAEEQNDSDVEVIAFLKSGGDVVDYEVLFQRQKSGKWKKARLRKPFPSVPPPLQSDERDHAAERAATDSATAWLTLVDEGKLGESWDIAAPFLRDRTPRQNWVESGRAMRAALGNRLLRKQFAVMDTDTVGSAPTGHYVVFEYRTKFAERPNAFESVTAMLCDDGKWRVVGYSVR